MILGYKKLFPWNKPTEFERKIIYGYKKHTIRVDQHDRWHAGRRINHCYGVRTKYFEKFYNNDCTGTQKIVIEYREGILFTEILVSIDDEYFYDNFTPHAKAIERMKKLALNDGFESIEDFFKWFNTDFTGKLIHWTDLRY